MDQHTPERLGVLETYILYCFLQCGALPHTHGVFGGTYQLVQAGCLDQYREAVLWAKIYQMGWHDYE